MYSSGGVNITIEAPSENVIQEITYDGQEIYQTPHSYSEYFRSLIRKIDFSKVCVEDTTELDQQACPEEETVPETIPSTLLSLTNKIRDASTEIGVLLDILNICREKRYMVLDPVPQDPFEVKVLAQIYSRKKGLSQAAIMLTSAAERIRTCQSEINRNRTVPDFHTELLRLRQNWRLKKVANTIIGDLSYKTAGSRFQRTGMFEVTKADEKTNVNSPPESPNAAVVNKPASALNVTVPAELEGVAYIMVLCQKDNENVFNSSLSLLGPTTNASTQDVHWQQKLEAAQNVLFCKELFSQLAREAVQLQAPIPHLVIGNQIMGTVLPGIQLVIGLCHSSGNEKKAENVSSKSNHDHVLEHSLHQLLREVHYKNTHHPLPHPSSGPLGPSKKRYLAGPVASDRYDLIEIAKSSTLLEQIIEQTQYFFMRSKAEYVLDTISKELKDPMIISHWNSLNSPSPSCAKITIISHGFDAVYRTSFLLQILKNHFKCICKDGRVMTLSYEQEELKDFIYYQVHTHQIIGVQNIAKSMGWQLLTSSPQLGVGPVQPYTCASSTILVSSIGDRLIAIKCEPYGKVQISIAHSPRKDFFSGQLVKERKWENLGGSFKEVRWEKMEGKNFLNKMELLMASLTSSS